MIPTIGRIVHFVLEDGPSRGQHRPAIITRTWEAGRFAALQVFTNSDPHATDGDKQPQMLWKAAVEQDPVNKQPGTWHAPETA